MDDIDRHPDLTDEKWLRAAEKRARRAARKSRPRRPGPRYSRLVIPVVLVLFCGALIVLYRVGSVELPASAAPPTTAATPTTTTAPEPTRAEADGHVDLAQPFAATPAADWPTDVPAPAGKATGPFTAAQVAAAYQAVRRTTTEARLDPEVILKHDNTPYLATLAPGVKLPDPGTRLTKIADGYQLLPAPPKVTGDMTSSVGEHGELVVHTNFVYAYAFQPASHQAPATPWDIVSVIHENADYQIVDGKPWPSTENSYLYAMNCDLAQQGLLGPLYSGPGSAARPGTESPQAYYDPKHPVNTGDRC
ncbi:hypothetical protein [Kutzneria sp. NPDC051319]|uniref:hypothetical protein n=1 Tax=Kutzneria sp. NPDC051319 TaxID=3155047 RepID=UPI003427BB42